MRECGREAEVREALQQGRWPQGCVEDLRAHVAGCGACGEVARVGAAMQRARAAAMLEARVASAGLVWWRAQLMQKQRAMEAVGKPMRRAQAMALAAAMCVAGVMVVVLVKAAGGWQAVVERGSLTAMVSGMGMLTVVAVGVMLSALGAAVVFAAVGRE